MTDRPRPVETGRHAVLYPAVAEAARRVGADAVGLIDVGCSAGFNLIVDRVGVTYGGELLLGDPSSPVQLSASVVGDGQVPSRAMPEVVARTGIDPDPIDVTCDDGVRRLRACVPSDRLAERARLDAEIEVARSTPRSLVPGGGRERLPQVVAGVPAGAVPVVTTTWALSRVSLEERLRFLHCIIGLAARRPVAWVSVEGVGVAPSVPTFGDRPASGHSIIGVTVLGHAFLRSDAVGRCWSRGRQLSWTAEP